MGYGQYCGCARALDIVGDRWTLLIVRELLVRPARYSQLRDGLPGIATNLLSNRLKTLQAGGVVERRLADPGVVYALTPWGEQLREPLAALATWSAPLMTLGPQNDAFRPHWLVIPLGNYLAGRRMAEPTRVGLHVEDATLGVNPGGDGVSIELEMTGPFDVELTVAAPQLLALVSGARSLDEVLATGAVLTGDRATLEALLVVPSTRMAVS